ncbi:hypothetical protein MJO29_009170 [Puccinia striiformis f. sp. tritici]|uniref:Uncharacterized protein n=3 Tax=Puccinia striiformis TaxID=27350 RepID=A0A0L0URR9_9BASI|nr:hypothetical protein Pst134EA_017969 [Puccinia striiformis f. sp. tritici]KAI9616042.1 hypothetical protein H4Q26_011294 [Puccinia striiformis f. sp. tritici PST-130]KNE89787.1 hypothetical protein PSTG_16746 [Puccinia striiformis f. sp. tritici PST-78]POW06999.1 hypothetical protein PSTT_08550 [Puccinia striiformis]KAH9451403.1 hypothetical protein Pst134EB_018873 [Puccinia striiformis f. sp. tritici]KAH9461680.1 hypothetical protein Pst134EA_017969 [Puccinia striiformis f. sp. tritici]
MAKDKNKQEKLARKLLPNQSIRSDQKKLSSRKKSLPPSSIPSLNKEVEIEWFDCSQNTENRNRECLKILFESIDTPPSLLKITKDRDFDTPERELELIPQNKSNYLRYKDNSSFILGLNSTLKYLQNLRLILLQLTEAIHDNRNRTNNHQAENEKPVNPQQDEDRNKLPSILKDFESVRYVIIFKHLQHLSVIKVLSSLVNDINVALSNFNFRQRNHHPLIQLIGFPVNLNTHLTTRFKVRRLSCFAILDSATAVERLNDFFKA